MRIQVIITLGYELNEKSISVQDKVQEGLLILYQPNRLIIISNLSFIIVLIIDFILIFTSYCTKLYGYALIFIINTSSCIPYHIVGMLGTIGSIGSAARYFYCLHFYGMFAGCIFVFLRILVPPLIVNYCNSKEVLLNGNVVNAKYFYPVDAMVLGIILGIAFFSLSLITRVLTTYYLNFSEHIQEAEKKIRPNITGEIRRVIPPSISS